MGVVLTAWTGDLVWLFLSLPFTLVLFVASRYAPTGYRLARDGLHIERRAGPVVIPYRTIRGADRMVRPVIGVSAFASRGLFGWFGHFWNPRLGVYRLYLANRQHVVWLATNWGWVGISPDRPDEFLERLRSRLAPGP